MQTIIQIEPNEWVSEDLLMAVTGMKRGTITRARKSSWLLGREYKHVSPEGDPKPTSECMYNRKAVDAWTVSYTHLDVYKRQVISWVYARQACQRGRHGAGQREQAA